MNFHRISLLVLGITYMSVTTAQDAIRAQDLFNLGNYSEALKEYTALAKLDSSNSVFRQKMGQCYLKTNINPRAALPHLLVAANSSDAKPEVWLEVAEAYMYWFKYDEAREAVGKYLANSGKKQNNLAIQMLRNCDAAQELMNFPVSITFENAGPTINTEFPDYAPYIIQDESAILFNTRRKSSLAPKPEFDGFYSSDIMRANMGAEGFQEAREIGSAVNSSYDELVVGASLNGDTIFVYSDRVESYGNLFISAFENKSYGRPKKIEGKLNSGYVESSAAIHPDGNTIIFSSDRNGGQGGFDLYMARRLPDNSWGTIQNLGPLVNTGFDEQFPVFHPDGRTIYFSSTGHPGMGNADLFFTVWDPETNTFTKPQNLGYPVNTPGDDRNISFCHNGAYAYTSALRPEGMGDLDIYRITFQEKITDPAVFRVNLAVTETQTAIPQISIRNEYDELVGQYLPNKLSGRYVFALYPGKYFLYLDGDGIRPYNEVLIVNDYHTRQEQNVKTIDLTLN